MIIHIYKADSPDHPQRWEWEGINQRGIHVASYQRLTMWRQLYARLHRGAYPDASSIPPSLRIKAETGTVFYWAEENTMTPFAQTILDTLIALAHEGERTPSLWKVAERGFPDMWKRRATHGGLISRIREVAESMPEVGRLPGRDRWDSGCLYLKDD